MFTIHITPNRFFIGENAEEPQALIDTSIQDGILTIHHTEVGDSLKGQGAGGQLVASTVDYARKHGLKIHPVCTYARSQFEKKPEYADVWFKD